MKKLKVIGYEFFTMPGLGGSNEFIAANLFLEDGNVFTLYNIPRFIAIECMRLTNRFVNDFRLSISEVLAEIPELEKAISRNIKNIVIDGFDPELGVYSATIKKKNGDSKEIRVIPSHALLLSIIGGVDIYVKEELVKKQIEEQKSY